MGSLTYSPVYTCRVSELRNKKGAAKITPPPPPPQKNPHSGCQWARRSNYHIAQIRQLLSDQEYLHCAEESEEGQTVLTRHTSSPPADRGAPM